MSIRQQIAIPITLTQRCEARTQAIKRVEEAFRLLGEGEQLLREQGTLGLPYDAKPRDSLAAVTARIDRDLWRVAFEQTGLMQIMDAQARAEFERDLDKSPPAFTEANVRSVLLMVHQQADELFVRGLVNVFSRLSGHYRSNSAFKLARKVVLERMVTKHWNDRYVEINGWVGGRYTAADELNDMDRVFHLLDRKAHTPRRLEDGMNAAFQAGEVYQDEYFRARAFKKGTLHLWFLREDLLDRANRMIADYFDGRAVPDARKDAA